MGRLIARGVDSKSRITARRAQRGGRAVFEALEDRRYMSLTMEVRTASGGATAQVAHVGDVLNLELLAVITGKDGDPSMDALIDLTGSLLATGIYSNDVAGNLSATVIDPFNSNGFQNGTPQDLNGDGNLDVGSNNPPVIDGFLNAHDSGVDSSGTTQSGSLVIEVATITYTVTNLNQGGETDLTFRPRTGATGGNYYGAVWTEDDADANDLTNTFVGGAPFKITDSALNPAPIANSPATQTVQRNTPDAVNVLASVTSEDALVASTVTVASEPAHGSAVVQSSGAILYTPTNGYLGSDSLTYHVTDANGRTSNNATVNFNVVPPAPPVTVADSGSTLLNQPVTLNVLANDTAPSGTIVPSTVAIMTPASNGTAVAQSDGTIIYTPNTAFIGTDTFTYTVADSLGDTSSAATVTVTVSRPVPPTAVNDIASAVEAAPTSINVLGNDLSPSGTLVPATVAVLTPPAHGTAVPQSDGTILYTSNAGYVGADSFTYTVADSIGDLSNTGTVAVTVTQAPAPTATSSSTFAVNGNSATINVLANVTGSAPLVPSSVTITTPPANGTATVNTSDGSVVYVSTAGFVGADSFAYTVSDANGLTTSPVSETVNVGAELNTTVKGGNRSITFTDATGAVDTVTLNSGIADVNFAGSGTATTTKGKVVITGSSLQIASIELSGTKKSSALVVRAVGNKPITIGAISDSSPMGSITAKTAALTGAVNINGLASLTVASVTNSNLTIGSTVPKVTLSLGTVTGSSLTSSVPVGSLTVASWTPGSQTGISIAAPSITKLVSKGEFDPGLTLSTTGNVPSLGSAVVNGAINGGTWQISGGVKSIVAGSIGSAWVGNIGGALTSLTIKSNGLADALTAGTIGSLVITGNLTGAITTASAKSIRVIGDINDTTLNFTGAAGLGTLTAASLSDTTVLADVATSVTLSTATAATLGTGSIGSINLTSKVGDQFTDSSILADKIRSLSLGTVATDNSSNPEGVAAVSLKSFTGIFGSTVVRLGPVQLGTESILQSYIEQQSIAFGDFGISLVS